LALILHIETATQVCSVALSSSGKVLGLKESDAKNSHSSILTVFIDEMIKTAGVALSDIDAVAVSKGPGSYTGLRIGVAAAKGLCFALDKPLIAVSTLQAMGRGMRDTGCGIRSTGTDENNLPRLFCPMIDARRMEVFCALFDKDGKEIRETRAEIIDDIMEADEERLYLRKDGHTAWVFLVYGNEGWTVICDYNISLEALLEPINALAESLEDAS